MSTNSTIIHEWQDAPEPGGDADEWPYPTSYTKSLITGELADRIRERLGVDAPAPVFLTEKCVSGGYSEYTQENDYYHTIETGGHTVEMEAGWSWNPITSLINWLDKTEESA
jgi:hypothetical protein